MGKLNQLMMTATCLAAFASQAFAGTCTINGVGGYSGTSGVPVLTSTNLQTLGNVCGTTVYASSGTCFFKIDNSDSITSGDCLTVGKGVTLTTAPGVELVCDDDSCGSAIKASASGSGNTTMEDLTVLGCWTRGIEAVTSNDVVSRATINLGHFDSSFACTMDNYGVFGSPVRIESSVIAGSHNGSNLGTTCVNSAGKVQDSVLKNCKYGAATQTGGEYDNAVFWNNYIALSNATNATLKGSSIVAGSNTYSPGGIDCNCYASSTCSDISTCIDFGTPTSFEEEARRN